LVDREPDSVAVVDTTEGTHDPREVAMTQPTLSAVPQSAPIPVAIPLRQLLPWTIFGVLLALVIIYFVGAEEGATSLVSGTNVHEFMHDGRHMLGFPCH
jgi:hypothetical protein